MDLLNANAIKLLFLDANCEAHPFLSHSCPFSSAGPDTRAEAPYFHFRNFFHTTGGDQN